jgi:transcriptional regulator
MYQPAAHVETDLVTLHALMRAHPLGAWVTLGTEGLIANHVPFLLDTTRGEFGTLCCHVARANPVWKSFSKELPSVVMFQGANTYITPSWYPSKHEHGKAVPTWNYAVVHAHGTPVLRDDAAWVRTQVDALTQTHEGRQALPWKVSDAPDDFIEQLINVIVGIEIPITRLEGKWKVSQNRPLGDKLGVVAGLTAQQTDEAQSMAAMVQRHTSR